MSTIASSLKQYKYGVRTNSGTHPILNIGTKSLLLDVSNYLLPGIGMEPPYLGITSPPRELLASVMAAIALDEAYRLG